MSELHSRIRTNTSVFRTKTLRTIYFENSVLGRTLWLLGMTYSNPSDKIEALSIVRGKNNSERL